MKKGVLTVITSPKMTKDERRRRRSSFGSHIAHGDVAPGPLANMERKGMGSEYSPGTTNDD